LRASMAEQPSRPFYGEYAWAFDLLIDRPVGQECAAITAWFSECARHAIVITCSTPS
jgi:hypothetical protein